MLYQPIKLKEIEEIRRCKEASESTKKKMIRCREQLFVRRIEIELDRLMMDHFNRAEVRSVDHSLASPANRAYYYGPTPQ